MIRVYHKGMKQWVLLLVLGGSLYGASLHVDVATQTLTVFQGKAKVRSFPVSTAKRGTGNREGSYQTPTGRHRIAQKIGAGYPVGAIFVGRQATGERAAIYTDATDTDDDFTLTRILRLEGLEPGGNKGGDVDSFSRFIYIHGTNEEGLIGTPASDGCIRMTNRDVLWLFDRVSTGDVVRIQ